MRRLLTALAAALVLAAPAQAQLPIITPPAVAPPAPGADTTALGGDAAHRNWWQGTGLRPPLELAWRVPATPAVAPLAVGGRVIVESTNALTAYNAADGAQQWQIGLPGYAELASDGTSVFVAAANGVTAVSAATGAVVWHAGGSPAVGPAVSGGLLAVGTAAGTVDAYLAGSGTRVWSAPTGITAARPAISGRRVYVTGKCGAAALSAYTGAAIWRVGCATDTGTRTLLNGLAVSSQDAAVYGAADGAVFFPASGPGTISADDVFAPQLGAAQLEALDARSLSPRWRWTPPLGGRLALPPAAVDGSIWQVVTSPSAGVILAALDPAGGAEQWSAFLLSPSVTPGVAGAVSAAPGLLLVTTDNGLVALRNAPPGPLGVQATIPKNVYVAGSRTTITGTLVSNGHGLVGPRRVTLEADRFPFGGYAAAGSATAGPGGFTLRTRIVRNTRLRFRVDGAASAATTIYARPELTVVYRRTSRPLIVHARLRVRARGLKAAGADAAVYRLKRGATVLQRLGAGVARAGNVATFDVRIPLDLKRSDSIVGCIRGASRQGFGVATALDRRCGARRIPVGAQASASARRSLSTGTGSAMPLKRLAPASEKR